MLRFLKLGIKWYQMFISGLFVTRWDMNADLLYLKESKPSHNNYQIWVAMTDGINENCDEHCILGSPFCDAHNDSSIGWNELASIWQMRHLCFCCNDYVTGLRKFDIIGLVTMVSFEMELKSVEPQIHDIYVYISHIWGKE